MLYLSGGRKKFSKTKTILYYDPDFQNPNGFWVGDVFVRNKKNSRAIPGFILISGSNILKKRERYCGALESGEAWHTCEARARAKL